MPKARLLALCLILPLSFACQSAHAAPGSQAPHVSSAGLLPPAEQAIEVRIEAQTKTSMADLVQQLSAVTGVQFTATEDVRQVLATTPCGLSNTVTIPPSGAWRWVESLLLNNGFTLGVLATDAPQLVAVYSSNVRQQGNRVQLRVEEADLDVLDEHPALLVVLNLELPHMDVRQLGNSLRALTTDPTGSQSVVPVGNTNSVLLTGTAGQVATLGRLLRAMDTVAGESPEPAKPETTQAPSGLDSGAPAAGQ